MSSRFVAPLAAGALLQLGCGGRETHPARVPLTNPPAPEEPAPEPAEPASNELAPLQTNPPIPSLVVTAAGTCHPANGPRGQAHGDWTRVPGDGVTTYYAARCDTPDDWCGEAVACPDGMTDRIAAWKAESGAE